MSIGLCIHEATQNLVGLSAHCEFLHPAHTYTVCIHTYIYIYIRGVYIHIYIYIYQG